MTLRARWTGLLGVGLSIGLAAAASADLLSFAGNFSQARTYPNPWRIDRHGSQPMVFDHLPDSAVSTLRIFTISGEHVRTLSGTQRVEWDMRNGSGQTVASGVYLYLLSSNNDLKTGKVVVIR